MTRFNLDEFNLAKSAMSGDLNRAIADAEASHKAAVATAAARAPLPPAVDESVPPGPAAGRPAGERT